MRVMIIKVRVIIRFRVNLELDLDLNMCQSKSQTESKFQCMSRQNLGVPIDLRKGLKTLGVGHIE